MKMYNNIELITKDTHKDAGVGNVEGFAHAKNLTTSMITMSEFYQACKNYPIVFTNNKEEGWFTVALLGLEKENQFLNEEGLWKEGCYIPAYVRRYPFIYIRNEDDLLLGFDSNHKVSKEEAGDRYFYDEKDQTTPFVANVLTFMNQVQSLSKLTKEFIKVWKEEQESWNKHMSPTLYKRLYAISQEGKNNQITNDIELLLSLSKTKELKNDDSLYCSIMGEAYYNLKEYHKAIDAYQKAVEINPQKDEAYYNTGVAYYHLKKFDEVIECYKKAIDINANKSIAYTNLFELQLTQNEPFDQELEKDYLELFSDNKESKVHYDMLKVFENISKDKESGLDEWLQEYNGISLDDWSFDELRDWIAGVEDVEIKNSLHEALVFFEKRELKRRG